jgi:hypothetical protein
VVSEKASSGIQAMTGPASRVAVVAEDAGTALACDVVAAALVVAAAAELVLAEAVVAVAGAWLLLKVPVAAEPALLAVAAALGELVAELALVPAAVPVPPQALSASVPAPVAASASSRRRAHCVGRCPGRTAVAVVNGPSLIIRFPFLIGLPAACGAATCTGHCSAPSRSLPDVSLRQQLRSRP